MKIKTSELKDAALDWAVAVCEDKPIKLDPMGFKTGSEAGYWIWEYRPNGEMRKIGREYSPSTNWAQGGPIIERKGEEITVTPERRGDVDVFIARKRNHEDLEVEGIAYLEAAMRCRVLNKLGPVVEVPDVLLRSMNFKLSSNKEKPLEPSEKPKMLVNETAKDGIGVEQEEDDTERHGMH